MLNTVKNTDKELYEIIKEELERQRTGIEMIASENFVPAEVLELQGSILTNKTAEGFPGKRYHAGCSVVDKSEILGIERAKKCFGAGHANIQPNGGSSANECVYNAVLKKGDTVLAMDLAMGGHLSHGHKVNFSGKIYNFVHYGLNRDTEIIDYEQVERLAKEHRPKLIVAGASSYPRCIDYERFANIAKSVDAYFLVDMAHVAGLVAAGVHPNPVPHADFVTSTTTKTLKGARGGFILCKKEYADKIDKAVFPGVQGGPILQTMAAKAFTFKAAMSDEFKEYSKQVVANAKTIATELANKGFRIVSGGTDNHLVLVDVRSKGLTGVELEQALEYARITVNKNMIPFDPNPPVTTSGVRIGAAAMTSRGMKEAEMIKIAELINMVAENIDNKAVLDAVKAKAVEMSKEFPLYRGYIEE